MTSVPAQTPSYRNEEFQFPGFGLPLNTIPRGENVELFRNALDGKGLLDRKAELPLTTLREFTMLQLMNQLTDKLEWHEKVFDEKIVSKWREEALSNTDEIDITHKMVDWCIAELQYKSTFFKETGALSVYNGDVVKSDSAIPEALKEALKKAVTPLEQTLPRDKDWHPGSNEKVLDLVHPSLTPLIYGHSRILPNSVVGLDDCIRRSGEGVIIPVPPEEEAALPDQPINRRHGRYFMPPFSRQFQWLPSNVDISGGEDNVRITSYINNLHPEEHQALYGVIEEIISRTIPLWNMTLTPLKNASFGYKRITYTDAVYDPDPEAMSDSEGPQQDEDEDEDDYMERRQDWISDTRVVVLPEPGPFHPPPAPATSESVDILRDYTERGIQVIVKLANIHLTPKKPKYEGGSWHVEGQLNEHICASAIYYYDSENITASRLAFRQQCSTNNARNGIAYSQNTTDWLEDVFGCSQDQSGIQEVGAVDTREGPLLTWPNILQHKVQPFELVDRTKPGHRKILALFLVDPNIHITSTANVPCQQREWWGDAVRKGQSNIGRFPAELQDHIIRDVEDFPISLQEAKELRIKLMEERKVFVKCQDEAFTQHEFSLCEH